MTPTDRNLMAGTASDNATPVQSAQAKPEPVACYLVINGFGKPITIYFDKWFADKHAQDANPTPPYRVVAGVFVPKEG